MAPRYKVTLTLEERKMLEQISMTGVKAAKTILHARALLLLDAGEYGLKWKVSDVADAIGMTSRSLEHLKEKFVEKGLEDAIKRKQRETPPRPIIFDGEFEAKLLQLACSKSPEGYAGWTIRLLADKLVELKIVPTVSSMTVWNTLKKMNSSLISANTGKFLQTKIRHL